MVHDKNRTKFKCSECPVEYFRLKSLKAHLARHKGEKYPCDQCGKEFTSKDPLKAHKKYVHVDVEKKACEICGKTVKSTLMKRHIKIHRNETEKKTCPICLKEVCNLINHLKIHKPPSFSCDVCLKTFTLSQNLKRHACKGESKDAIK